MSLLYVPEPRVYSIFPNPEFDLSPNTPFAAQPVTARHMFRVPYPCTEPDNPPNVRFGSKPDERGHRPGGPHLGVKQTKSGAKQTSPLEGLFSEVERSDRRVYGKELISV